MRGQRTMDFITSQQVMAVVESGRDEGGCAIEGQANNVAGFKNSPIRVRIHGGDGSGQVSVIFARIDSSTLGNGESR